MTEVARESEPGGVGPPPEELPPAATPPEDTPPEDNGWRREYWRRNVRLMVVLLSIWFIVSFGCGILFVEQLNEIEINGFPLGFWFAQQGSIYTFVGLILVYAVLMDRLDDRYGVSERDEGGQRL